MPIVQGAIVIWSGAIIDIPSGWALCDGTNSTPDLRNRFIVGAGDTYSVEDTGGSANAIVPSHTHTGTTDTAGAHTHTISYGTSGSFGTLIQQGGTSGAGTTATGSNGSHTHTPTIDTAGSSGTNANLPPYYALAFIIQTS